MKRAEYTILMKKMELVETILERDLLLVEQWLKEESCLTRQFLVTGVEEEEKFFTIVVVLW